MAPRVGVEEILWSSMAGSLIHEHTDSTCRESSTLPCLSKRVDVDSWYMVLGEQFFIKTTKHY